MNQFFVLTMKKAILAFAISLCFLMSPLSGFAQSSTLYGVIGNELVSISTTTGLATSVGAFNNSLTPLGNLAYHDGLGVLFGIANVTSTPNLVSLNPATGQATVVAPLILMPSGTPVGLQEGLAYNPQDGLLYGSLDTLSPPTSFVSHIWVTIDPATGFATKIADITGTCNDEADAMDWMNGSMFILDGCPNPNILYKLNTTNGAANQLGITGVQGVGDFAYQASTGLMFGYNSNRQLFTIDTTSAAISVIGNTHTAADFAGQFMRGIAFVPGVLSRELIELRAWADKGGNRIYWEMSLEVGEEYAIERSTDTEFFHEVGRLRGNQKVGEGKYEFIDQHPHNSQEAVVFYRIKTWLPDGKESLSPTVEVRRKGEVDQLQNIWPNPVESGRNVHIEYHSESSQVLRIRIIDLLGRTILSTNENVEPGYNQILLTLPDLLHGAYWLGIEGFRHKTNGSIFIIDKP